VDVKGWPIYSKCRRNIAENFNRLRVHERYRQTDRRQTDGRVTVYSKREREFTFAKKVYENPVYTIQPVVKPVVQRVWQPTVSCKQTSNRLSKWLSNRSDNRFDNRIDNRLYRVNGALETETCDKSRVRRDHPRCRSAMWICMYGHTPDVVIYSKFHIESCSPVLEPRGSKFAHSRYFGYWSLQQLALPCKPWWPFVTQNDDIRHCS